jgi:lipid A 4'-phosphatase
MKTNKKMIWLDFGIPALILIVCTILFRKFNLDIQIQDHFFKVETGWFLKSSQPWLFLYDFGNLPALILSVASLILLSVSFFKLSLTKYRKIFIFMTIVMAIGPGLLVNSILKDNWGRPRPRDIIEFGGNYNYEKVLEIDPDSKGKSFPCGHASMGFYLMTLFFIFRKNRKLIAYFFLFIGLIYGGLIGLARIVQGGHFASDVIWAGGLVYLVATAAYYFLKMDRSIFLKSDGARLPVKRNLIVLIIILATIVLTLLTIMADSHHYNKSYSLDASVHEIVVKLERGDVELIESDSLSININAIAHGFPWSKLKTKVKSKDNIVTLKQRESGYFTEVNQTITVIIPDNSGFDVFIKILDGNVIFADSFEKTNIKVDIGEGRVIK